MYIVNKKSDYLEPYNKLMETKEEYLNRIVDNITSVVIDIDDVLHFDIVDSAALKTFRNLFLYSSMFQKNTIDCEAIEIENNSLFNRKLIYTIISNQKIKSKDQYSKMDIAVLRKYIDRVSVLEEELEVKMFGIDIAKEISEEEQKERVLKEMYIRDCILTKSLTNEEFENNQISKKTVVI